MESKKTFNIFKQIKNKVMEKDQKFLSLYDYLGYPAGWKLGAEVAAAAKAANQPTQTRYVENPKYKGKVFLYTLEFLDIYFNKSTKTDIITNPDYELPF